TAEKELELQFHHGYKKFLIKYGGGSVGFCNIYGLKRAPGMDEKINTVITNTRFYKDSQKWPGIQNWYIVSSDLSGNPIGMDSEGKVWLSDHDAG
ncbi:SMI1/KNR4 family protein, partial [Acinetobacter baumannii]